MNRPAIYVQAVCVYLLSVSVCICVYLWLLQGYSTLPPTIVWTTLAVGISSSGTLRMSFDSTVMSAYLPRLQRAAVVFFESGVGAVDGVRLQRFHARHALIRVEDRAVLQLTADRRVIAGDRIDIFHRRVGAVGTIAPDFISFCQT